jgi:hypothetical protein
MIDAISDRTTGFRRSQAESEVQPDVTRPPNSDDADNEEVRSLWDELGLPEPPFFDENKAPPVDRELLRQLVRRELSEERDKAVGKLVVLFKSWSDAHLEVVREESRRRRDEK